MLHVSNMTKDTSNRSAQPSGESLPNEAEKMALWKQGLKYVDRSKVDQNEDKHWDNLIDNEILDSYFPRKEPSGGPLEDHLSRSEVGMLMEVNIKTMVEVITSRVIMGIVGGTIEDVFIVF